MNQVNIDLLDFRVASKNLGRAIEELFYSVTHPNLVSRREPALNNFSDSLLETLRVYNRMIKNNTLGG